MNKIGISLAGLALSACFGTGARADVTIADQGKSTFTIVMPARAPQSVQKAAKELQRDIAIATGATLSIKKDSDSVSGNIISLGSTKQAATAKLSAGAIADSGYRILAKGGNLYIIGLDTAATQGELRGNSFDTTPDPNADGPQYTKEDGFSNGTANGVYTFLEDYLNVHWLMPGELGLDVPKRSTFSIPDIDRTDTPAFIFRDLNFVMHLAGKQMPQITDWQSHQKLGSSISLNYTHNWQMAVTDAPSRKVINRAVVAKIYAEHPDWLAMDENGKRPLTGGTGKFETTNPEFVKFYAEKAVAALKANPHMHTFSVSPDDGGNFSKSPESLKYYDPAGKSQGEPVSVTPLVLKFYRDVSAIIAKEYPQGKTAGFLYREYLFPPSSGDAKLPPNFFPVIAPNANYAFGLYRPQAREESKEIFEGWHKANPTHSRSFVYDELNIIFGPSNNGLVAPPGTDLLKFYFPLLADNGIKGITTAGYLNWSNGALYNYMLAKLTWNPRLDPHALQNEWLARAYGEKAGAAMEKFYDALDGYFSAYVQLPKRRKLSNLSEATLEDLFGANYPALEKLFLQAKAQPMTGIQQQRLNFIEMNMAVLQWRLHKAGYLPKTFETKLPLTNEQVADLLLDNGGTRWTKDKAFELFPIYWGRNAPHSPTAVKVELVQGAAPKITDKSTVNRGYIQLYSPQENEAEISVDQLNGGSAFVGYSWHLIQPDGRLTGVRRGLCYAGQKLKMKMPAGSMSFFQIEAEAIDKPTLEYNVSIANAATAQGDLNGKTLQLYSEKTAPLYVYASDEIWNASDGDGAVNISRRPAVTPAETARAAVLAQYPGAKVLSDLDKTWWIATDAQGVGERDGYASPDYNNKSWRVINATKSWQDQGINFYGTVWYRKPIYVSKRQKGKILLHFGNIDGDAVIYLDGKKIGEHSLAQGWKQPVIIDVTDTIKGKKTFIAVKVTKKEFIGGLYMGAALLNVP